MCFVCFGSFDLHCSLLLRNGGTVFMTIVNFDSIPESLNGKQTLHLFDLLLTGVLFDFQYSLNFRCHFLAEEVLVLNVD